MLQVIKEAFEEIEKKFKNIRLQIDISLHMPFYLEDALLYCIQCIHDNIFILLYSIICHQVGSQYVQIADNCMLRPIIVQVIHLVVILSIGHEKIEFLLYFESCCVFKVYQELYNNRFSEDKDSRIDIADIVVWDLLTLLKILQYKLC